MNDPRESGWPCAMMMILGFQISYEASRNLHSIMPRGRKRRASSDSEEEEESEYEEDESDVSLQVDDDDDEDSMAVGDEGSDAEPHKSKAYMTSLLTEKKNKKFSKKPFTTARPFFDRNGNKLTERGGYAHNTSSKLKISAANKGKTPWNKDKQRSGTDKAKISAGVKARNRAILLQQLKEWDMTEEEYADLKKKTKSVRERLRRLKAANQNKLNHLKVKLEPASASESEEEAEEKPEEEDQVDQEEQVVIIVAEAVAAEIAEATGPLEYEAESQKDETQLPDKQEQDTLDAASPFRSEYCWEPHPFDTNDSSVYAQACPNDGPGGLICCSICTANYSRYLSTTYSSMAQQSVSLMGREAKELGSFLQGATEMVEETLPGTSKQSHTVTVKPKRARRY
jgi:hypothetical protein